MLKHKITIFTIFIAAGALQAGCANRTTSRNSPVADKQKSVVDPARSESQHIQDKITEIVAKQLGIEPGSVDIDLPLSKQKTAADELDVVEIVMNVEKELNVEIKDEEIGGTLGNVIDSLSVRKLVEIVSRKGK